MKSVRLMTLQRDSVFSILFSWWRNYLYRQDLFAWTDLTSLWAAFCSHVNWWHFEVLSLSTNRYIYGRERRHGWSQQCNLFGCSWTRQVDRDNSENRTPSIDLAATSARLRYIWIVKAIAKSNNIKSIYQHFPYGVFHFYNLYYRNYITHCSTSSAPAICMRNSFFYRSPYHHRL